jgi:hypothetical protein
LFGPWPKQPCTFLWLFGPSSNTTHFLHVFSSHLLIEPFHLTSTFLSTFFSLIFYLFSFFFHHLVAHYAHNWLFFQFLRSQNARVAHWSSYTIFFIINWYILLYSLYKYIFLYKVGSTFSIQWLTMLTHIIFNASHRPSLLTNIYF